MDQAKGDLLLGTDFRHAVEFSRSGRARFPANFLAVLRGGDSHCTPSSAAVEPQGFIRRFPRPCGPVRSRLVHGEQYTPSEGLCRGVPCAPSGNGGEAAEQGERNSGHAAGAELDAHSGSDGLRRLGDAVLPRPLAGAAHHDQVPVAQREAQALSAVHRSEQQGPR